MEDHKDPETNETNINAELDLSGEIEIDGGLVNTEAKTNLHIFSIEAIQ